MVYSNQTKLFLGIFSRFFSTVKWTIRLFLGAGIVLIVIGSYNIYKAYKTTSWPSVQGHIISSEITSRSSTYTDSTTNRLKDQTIYNAQINYSYVINGITYSNDVVKVGGTIGTNTKSWARELLNKYPQGKIVDVYYNPEDPFQSVLEKGLQLSTWVLLGLGLAIFIFAIYFKKRFLYLSGTGGDYNKEREAISTTGRPISSSATDPQLLGKWEVVYQTPSYEQLAAYSMKHVEGKEFSSENAIIPNSKTIVTITKNKIYFKMQDANFFSDGGLEYILQHNRLVLVPVKMNIFLKAIEDLRPSYYHYSFSDSKLILTSNKIKGCDNQSIVYHLKRA